VLEFDKNEILVEATGGDLRNPIWNYKAGFDVSRKSDITVSAYLRRAQCAPGQADMGNDLPVARVEFTPNLDGFVRPSSTQSLVRANRPYSTNRTNGTLPPLVPARSTSSSRSRPLGSPRD
jgi:hypothetical protein